MDDKAKHRALSVLGFDQQFREYAVELSPQEAIHFAEYAIKAGVPDEMTLDLLMRVEKRMPVANRGEGHPETGRSTHVYRVGRQVGKRVVFLEIGKSDFHKSFDFTVLFRDLELYAKSTGALFEIAGDQNGWAVEFLWV